MNRPVRRSINRRMNRALTLSAAIVLGHAAAGFGATYDFTGATAGNWNVAANWSLIPIPNGTHAVPVNGDTAQLGFTGTAATSVNFNQSYTGAGLALLDIDDMVSSMVLNQTTGGTAMIASNEFIGNTNTENTYNQSAGSNTVTNTLTMGSLATSFINLYTLSGTGALSAAVEHIGNSGSGVVNQSGGTNAVSSTLSLGTQSGGNGQYTLNALNTGTGSLTALNEFIGDGAGGTGTFVQNAGTNSVSNVFYVGNSGNGTYTLGGGTLTLINSNTQEALAVGSGSTGTFIQSGGANNLSNGVGLEVGFNGVGNYDLNGGTLTSLYGGEIIGVANTGTFTQTNGTNSISGSVNAGGLYISDNLGVIGNYNLQGGALTTISCNELIGYFGVGTLTQSGNSSNFLDFSNASLYVGVATGAVGVYNLQQNASLNVAFGNEYIGGQPGVGAVPASAGATGTFTQTGGSNTINSPTANLYLGYNAGDVGIYNLQGGALTVNGTEYVGYGGNGTFTQSNNATNTLSGIAFLQVGFAYGSAGATGVYNLQGGQLTVGENEFVGDGSTGIFNQTGGTNNVIGVLGIGDESTGTYNLSGNGLLEVSVLEEVGTDFTAASSFNQFGGVNDAYGGLDIGVNGNPGGATGSYTLSAGTLNVSGNEIIGDYGVGSFLQSGSLTLNSVNGALYLGNSNGAGSGLYTLNAGTLTVSGGEFIGNFDPATFTQNGGTNNASGGLFVGSNGLVGTYNLSGPGVLNPSNITVGINSAFNVSQGQVNCAAGTLTAFALQAGAPGSGGTINFSQGYMQFAALDFSGNPGAFHWTGGTLQLNANVTLDPLAAPSTTGAAFGSSLTLNSGMVLTVNGNETIGGTGFFTLTINAGAQDDAGNLTVAPTGTLYENSAPIIFNLNNQGNYIYNGGTFTGQLTNSGAAYFDQSFIASNGLVNSGNVQSSGLGIALTLNGAGLSNSGSVALNGGSILTTNTVNNGLISGYGSISGSSIINNGVITQSGGNLALTSTTTGLSNTGTINLASGLALNLAGANATNDGTVNLDNGNLSGALTLTNNADGVVTGPGKINLTTFLNNGLLDVPNGTTTIGSFANNGVIEMAGVGADLGPTGTITNAATIEGFGKISEAITNNGTLQPTGGTIIVSGALTNPAAGTISAGPGAKLLVTSGLSTNAGLISLTGGTFDNNNLPLNNTGQIAGFGLVRTGGTGLTNNGTIFFTGGTTTINGPVVNNTTMDLNYQPATFTGAVNNFGTIKTTGMTATFASTLTNQPGSHYTSDPSENVFQAGVTDAAGSTMTGGSGDRYDLSGGSFNNAGNFTNAGLLNSSDPITNSGTFSQTGTLIQSANFTNSGTATIGGSQTWSAGTTFNNTGGTATFLSDAGPAGATLSINATGGAVNFAGAEHLAAISAGSGATVAATLTASPYVVNTNALTITGTGVVDMTANSLAINYASPAADPLAAIRGYLKSAYNGGIWTGAGLTSATVAAQVANAIVHGGGVYSMGYADGGKDLNQTIAVGNQIVVRPTLAGDTNMDGNVTFIDLGIVAQNLGATNSDWMHGDFNFDGSVNFLDIGLLAQNLNKTTLNTPLAEMIPDPSAALTAQWNLAVAEIQQNAVTQPADLPEPGMLSLLAVGGIGLLARRRRTV